MHNPKHSIIFDMDGVISNTQKLHSLSESKLFSQYGIDINPEYITANYAGWSDDEFFSSVFKNASKETPSINKLAAEKWEAMNNTTQKIEPMQGLSELLKYLQANNYKIAIASASPHHFINRVTSELKINHYFDAKVSADDVKHGKPAPDVFLKAAELVKAEPENCIVIEDGNSGIKGANDAGMITIGFTITNPEADYTTKNHIETLSIIKNLG